MNLCKSETSRISKGIASPLPCQNKAWKDGYCKVHHPDQTKSREQKYRENWERKWAAERLGKATVVASDEYAEARKTVGLLTLDEARKLGAKI